MFNADKELCPVCRSATFADDAPKPARRGPRRGSPEPTDEGDLCPVCGLKFTASCRCRRGNRWCPNKHAWHVCKVHRVRVLGTGHGLPAGWNECTCPKHSTEGPSLRPDDKSGGDSRPAEMSGPATFSFDLV